MACRGKYECSRNYSVWRKRRNFLSTHTLPKFWSCNSDFKGTLYKYFAKNKLSIYKMTEPPAMTEPLASNVNYYDDMRVTNFTATNSCSYLIRQLSHIWNVVPSDWCTSFLRRWPPHLPHYKRGDNLLLSSPPTCPYGTWERLWHVYHL